MQKPISPGDSVASDVAWCVKHLERDHDGAVRWEWWCRLAHQPKTQPRYSDTKKTACGYVVTLPCGFERRRPTCTECLEQQSKKKDAS